VAKKLFVTAQELLDYSFQLGHSVLRDGYHPDFIVGIWRGGATITIAMQEYFAYKGIAVDHYPIRVSSYVGMGRQSERIDVWGLDGLINHIGRSKRILIVDDVFETGRTIQEIVNRIEHNLGSRRLENIRVATIFVKPQSRIAGIEPDYFLYPTERWIVFPHELLDLTPEEIAEYKPHVLNTENNT